MREYPKTEGKYGVIYQIAEGVNVNSTKDGTWEVSVKHQGERLRKRFGRDLEKAVQAAELLAAKIGLSPRDAKTEKLYTMATAAQDWMSVNKGRWSANTLERYSGIVRDFIAPVIGEMPLEKVGRQHIKDLLVDALAVRSAKTVELIHAVISGIFGEAIDRGFARENPAHGLAGKVLPAKRKRNESRPDPFARDDLWKVIDAGWRLLADPLPLVVEVLACSGMRLGECLAMHRDNLDALNSQYMITQTVRHGKFGLPKSGERRLIDLPAELVQKLEAHILKLRKEGLQTATEPSYLFPGITQRMVQRGLERACRAAKIRVRSPHDLRHSYASILLMNHYSPAYVQKQLGHHSITMTVDIYGHWIPGEGKRDLGGTLKGEHLGPKKTAGRGSKINDL